MGGGLMRKGTRRGMTNLEEEAPLLNLTKKNNFAIELNQIEGRLEW
jgi:hypothetical protein